MRFNKAIEGTRGYLILCIILYHYTSKYLYYGGEAFIWSTGFLLGKNLGVAGFFMISGYLYFNSIKSWKTKSLLDVFLHVLKKIERLYIPYAIAIIFLGICHIFITYLNNPRWIDFVSNLLLLRTILQIPLVDGAHWYFYAMIQLNLLIPFLVLAYERKSLLGLSFSLVLGAYFFGTHVFLLNKAFLTCFIAGSMLSIENKKIALFLYAIFSLLAIYILKTPLVVIVFIILPLVINNELHKCVFHFLFENRVIVFLGTYSYMWYLIHQQLGYSIIHTLKGVVNDYLNIAITMLVTLIISVLLHKIASEISLCIHKK